jgi:phenylalanyl-tRNA synthetase beta chain
MAGLETEPFAFGNAWSGVRAGRVIEVRTHPRADSLWVVALDSGDRMARFVTTAPDIRLGSVVPFVEAGGSIGGQSISARAFSGIESEGMLLSEKELGIGDDHTRIYEFDEETTPPGTNLADAIGDWVLELYVTPNRPDWMSVVGVAREIHAVTGADFTWVAPAAPSAEGTSIGLSVDMTSDGLSSRFCAARVHLGSLVKTPELARRRLNLAGIRAISSTVDATNYAMLACGQPLHAFDSQRLSGAKASRDAIELIVRYAEEGERISTIDGRERLLDGRDMVVADSSGPVAIAGIMGGISTEIGEGSRDIILEAASWERASIRRTSSRLALQSEASRRFGRGVEPELSPVGLAMCLDLLRSWGSRLEVMAYADVYPSPAADRAIAFRPLDVDRLLGLVVPPARSVSILRSLGFDVTDGPSGAEPRRDDELLVTVPPYRRFDVERIADLVEEVGRVNGYQLIEPTDLQGRIPAPFPGGDGGYSLEMEARRHLAAMGLQEILTYSLIGRSQQDKLESALPERSRDGQIVVQNPQSAERSLVRDKLIGSVIEASVDALRHRDRVLLFEIGRTWLPPLTPLPIERRHLAFALSGMRHPRGWTESAQESVDFFDAKGIVEAVMSWARLPGAFEAMPKEKAIAAGVHPYRACHVRIGDEVIGYIGQLHPKAATAFGLGGREVFVAEIDLDSVIERIDPTPFIARTPSRQPGASRDLDVVVASDLPFQTVADAAASSGGPLLQSMTLIDVYTGAPLPADRKSLSMRLFYHGGDRTLTDDEIAQSIGSIVERLGKDLAAELR